jgi:hypothetical protein
MKLDSGLTLKAAIASMQKEREALGTAIAMLQALIATGVSASSPFNGSALHNTAPVSGKRARRGGKKPSIAHASIEILREAGRPMHGLREIIPALAARGVKVKQKASLATILLRTGEIERTSPGTYGLKGGNPLSRTYTPARVALLTGC